MPATPVRSLALFFVRACACVWVALAAARGAGTDPRDFKIAAGPATATLTAFAAQAGREIVYPVDAMAGVVTNTVSGKFTPRDAIDRLVAHTDLIVVEDARTGAFLVTRRPSDRAAPTHSATDSSSTTVKRHTPFSILGAFLALVLSPAHGQDSVPPPHASISATGTLTGVVSNRATKNLLAGASISVPALGLSTLTDNTGRFVVSDLPPGSYEVVASYIGLDTVRTTVAIERGERAVRNFDLTAEIYTMQALTVTGEREGDAAAITAQRNSTNLQDVVAMDSYGNLPNMSTSELVMRLPGIAGDPSDEGLAYNFNVRGIAPSLNVVTVDGGLMPNIGAARSFELQSITGTMFEQLEVIKGHTPDSGADSLGGTLNMKTRSPLNMKEKRRVVYTASVRVAPPFTEQIPVREEHRAHPLLNLSYQEVFGIFGAERNLGVAVNLFYSENAVGGFRSERDFQNVEEGPAYVWSYRFSENYNNRKQQSINVKTDYRYSFNTKFTLAFMLNDNTEHYRRTTGFRAFTGTATTVPSATTGIVPGYTDTVTTVRPTANSNIEITDTGPNFYDVRTQRLDFGGEHDYGPLDIKYNASVGTTDLDVGNGTGGYLTQRLSNVGWILDRTADDLHPKFIQTAGPDLSNPANYRPIANGLAVRPNRNKQKISQARADFRYALPTTMPVALKAGGTWRQQRSDLRNMSRQWSYIGTDPLPLAPTPRLYENVKTGLVTPHWDTPPLFKNHEPVNPALWREDLYYHEQLKYTGTRGVQETASAAYVMADGKLGRKGLLARTSFLGGVRVEKTEVKSYGYTRNRVGTTTAERTADPVGAAERDYADNYRRIHGQYTKSFPSVHVTHNITDNLKARLAWSTSFGRPPLASLLPNETVSETNHTLTVNNPNLLPQTAQNWDADLEYYFEPVGALSVSWFHKTIRDYIVSGINDGIIPGGTDNGYDGEYEGFTRLTSRNAGTAIVQGWEFSYRQQFTFLPGALRGLSGSANYTILDTHGNFGGGSYRKTGEVPGFIPRAANVSLNWRYRKFSTRVLYNFTGEHINTYSAISPALNEYVYNRRTTNLGLAYQIRPAVSLTCDITNVFNEPYKVYVGRSNRMGVTQLNFVAITFGVSGRF